MKNTHTKNTPIYNIYRYIVPSIKPYKGEIVFLNYFKGINIWNMLALVSPVFEGDHFPIFFCFRGWFT